VLSGTERISKITVTGALHDCLRPGELHAGTKALCMGKIRATGQQKSEFWCTDLVIELRVATFSDVYVERIRGLFDHLVFQGISGREYLEG
jgi:hypothetical protein